MYIIEKLIKIYIKLKEKINKTSIPYYNEEQELEDVITCEHNFMPIDSTGEILSCIKCGYLISKEKYIKRTKNKYN